MKFTPHSLIVLVLHGESLAPRAGPNSLTRMSWVHWQQVHRDNAAVVARSLGCQCDTEIPTGYSRTYLDLLIGRVGPFSILIPVLVNIMVT